MHQFTCFSLCCNFYDVHVHISLWNWIWCNYHVSFSSFLFIFFTLTFIGDGGTYFSFFSSDESSDSSSIFVHIKVMPMRNNKTGTFWITHTWYWFYAVQLNYILHNGIAPIFSTSINMCQIFLSFWCHCRITTIDTVAISI